MRKDFISEELKLLSDKTYLESTYINYKTIGVNRYKLISLDSDTYTLCDSNRDNIPCSMVSRRSLPEEPGLLFGIIGYAPAYRENDVVLRLRAIRECNIYNLRHLTDNAQFPCEVNIA